MTLGVGFAGGVADWVVKLWSSACEVEDVAHNFGVGHNPSFLSEGWMASMLTDV